MKKEKRPPDMTRYFVCKNDSCFVITVEGKSLRTIFFRLLILLLLLLHLWLSILRHTILVSRPCEITFSSCILIPWPRHRRRMPIRNARAIQEYEIEQIRHVNNSRHFRREK